MSKLTHPNTPQPTLLFIPDISGFTKFVNTTEIEHSRHIIEELLETLIDANQIGLQISEIEGDAILFYRQGALPTVEELLAQVERMYIDFHTHIKRYDTYRICNCGACCTAHDLSLKFVLHLGDIAMKQVKEFSKLFGPDVIIAHRLMKNDVPSDEYALFTSSTLTDGGHEQLHSSWAEPRALSGTYDFGDIDYCYVDLAPLNGQVPEPAIEDFSLPGHPQKVMEYETTIDAPLEMTFNVLSDMAFRHEWQAGIRDSSELNHTIAQHGSQHRCVISGRNSDPLLVAHDFEFAQDIITFTETDQVNGLATLFFLERTAPKQTRLQVQAFLPNNPIKLLLFRLLLKGRFRRTMEKSWKQFNAYCRSLQAENRQHPLQIVLASVA